MSDIVRTPVKDTVISILAEQAVLGPGAVHLTSTLEDLAIDSMGLVEAIFAIEEAFDIQVPFNANEPDESEFDISTVGSMVRAVEDLIAAQK